MSNRNDVYKGRQLTTEELKMRELKILSLFHEYCNQNNLKYCLAAGSLLGAIRHEGFIPWDDDIDVYMLRKDYMRLVDMFPRDGIEDLKLLTPFTDKNSPITFGKLYETSSMKLDNEYENKYQNYGIDIDIFPLDFIPSTKEDRDAFYKKQYFRFKIFFGIIGKYRKEKNVWKTIIQNLYLAGCKILSVLHVINANKIALQINKAAMEFEESEYVCSSMLPRRGQAKIYAKTKGFQERMLTKFEDREFYIPAGYDEYLTNTYGDYMRLPPKDQQVTHHLTKVYVKENKSEK